MKAIQITEAAGKTVARIGEIDDVIVVVFTDGTFLALTIYNGHGDGGFIRCCNKEEVVDLLLYGGGEPAVRLGLATQEVLDGVRDARQERYTQFARDARRAQYLELKREFEGEDK